MSTLELKLEIFDKLKSVEDEDLLKKIMTLLKTVEEDKIYHLNEYELDMVKEGEEDIKFGRVISQEQLDKEDLEWLSKQ
jgi:predicted transcriptional regulator